MKGGAEPLHGVPFSIKDLALTAGIRTMSGSPIFQHRVPGTDAPFVRRLKEAGGVMLGKTTTPEFGWKALGDSPVTGITRNPWNTGMTSGGSSAGAGVAAAAGFGPLHQGSDGAGSIRIRGLLRHLRHKPSYGRVPMWPTSNTEAPRKRGVTRTSRRRADAVGDRGARSLDRTRSTRSRDYVARSTVRDGLASRGAPIRRVRVDRGWRGGRRRRSRSRGWRRSGGGDARLRGPREIIRCCGTCTRPGIRRIPGRVPGPDGPGARRRDRGRPAL